MLVGAERQAAGPISDIDIRGTDIKGTSDAYNREPEAAPGQTRNEPVKPQVVGAFCHHQCCDDSRERQYVALQKLHGTGKCRRRLV